MNRSFPQGKIPVDHDPIEAADIAVGIIAVIAFITALAVLAFFLVGSVVGIILLLELVL